MSELRCEPAPFVSSAAVRVDPGKAKGGALAVGGLGKQPFECCLGPIVARPQPFEGRDETEPGDELGSDSIGWGAQPRFPEAGARPAERCLQQPVVQSAEEGSQGLRGRRARGGGLGDPGPNWHGVRREREGGQRLSAPDQESGPRRAEAVPGEPRGGVPGLAQLGPVAVDRRHGETGFGGVRHEPGPWPGRELEPGLGRESAREPRLAAGAREPPARSALACPAPALAVKDVVAPFAGLCFEPPREQGLDRDARAQLHRRLAPPCAQGARACALGHGLAQIGREAHEVAHGDGRCRAAAYARAGEVDEPDASACIDEHVPRMQVGVVEPARVGERERPTEPVEHVPLRRGPGRVTVEERAERYGVLDPARDELPARAVGSIRSAHLDRLGNRESEREETFVAGELALRTAAVAQTLQRPRRVEALDDDAPGFDTALEAYRAPGIGLQCVHSALQLQHDTTVGPVILQVYIFRQLLMAFTFAVGGMMFIALPGIAVAAVHKLAGVETAAIVRFIPLLMLGLVPYILPLGYLLATVVTFGRLAADNEWTAIRMAGIHPLWICVPPLILALLCSVGTVWLISTRLPEDKRNQTKYLTEAVTTTITSLSPGRTELHLGRFYLQAAYREGNEFRRAFIHIPGKDGRGSLKLQADSLSIDVDKEDRVLVIRMRDARVVHGSHDFQNANPTVRIDLSELIKPRKRGLRGLRYKTSGEISELLEFEEDPKYVARMRFEVHHRNAMATTFIMFCLLGIPTGLLLRRGTQLAALSMAVGYALVYYVLSLRLAESLAETQIVPPGLAAWSVNIFGVVAGLALSWKALRQ